MQGFSFSEKVFFFHRHWRTISTNNQPSSPDPRKNQVPTSLVIWITRRHRNRGKRTIVSSGTSAPAVVLSQTIIIMLSLRTALQGVAGLRSFSTSRVLRSEELSYQVFGPDKGQAVRSPILFLHGLFGSKQNNRSISR